jgi:5-hydroxyisourate hydrolase-like protein (transthyretin family)
LRSTYNVTGRVYQAVGTAGADDRGQYRLFGVPPGRYYLNIGNPPGPVRVVAQGGVLLGGLPGTGTPYALSFFPGVPDVSQAVQIEVPSGREVSFDMTARRQQLYRVRGTLLDSRTGQPPQGTNVQVSLVYRSPTGGGGTFSSGRTYDPATGKFELSNVIPGQYVVQAQLPVITPSPITSAQQIEERIATQAMQPLGRVPITVTDADVENVAIVLTAGVTVPGKVSVEGQALSAVTGIDRMRVTLRSWQDGALMQGGVQPGPGVVSADGSFQITGLREGEFIAQVNVTSPGFYVKSVRYGGSEILNNPFKFSGSGSGTIDVILRPGAARVSGVVNDARSQAVPAIQVVLVPEQRNRTELYRTATTDANGRFNFTNVTPGQYRAYSWEIFENGMQYDPDVLKKHEQQGKIIQVAEASDQNLDVKIIPMN